MTTKKAFLFSIKEREYNGDIVILDIIGEIDIATTPELNAVFTNLTKQGKIKIIVNLKNVTYVSSSGWGLFISLIKTIRNSNGDLKLVQLSPEVKVIFDMTSLFKLIPSYNTIEEAAEAF